MNKTIIAFLLTGLVFLPSCRKPLDRIETKQERKDNSLSTLVVFSLGDSRIVHVVFAVDAVAGDSIIQRIQE